MYADRPYVEKMLKKMLPNIKSGLQANESAISGTHLYILHNKGMMRCLGTAISFFFFC